MIGQRLGQYEIIGLVGEGGMGAVYRARDTRLGGREVAIKVLPPELARDAEFVARFEQEANTAAGLEHPNIVAIYNVGVQEDAAHESVRYIAMRLVQGETLQDLLQREQVLPPARALHIIEQLASALDYAHQHGFIHRDIKPANIMIGADDFVTLMDFGIAKALAGKGLTRTGMTIGTPEYMAPEQFTGAPVDARADLYALGVVLYEMLTGCVPFTADTPVAVSHGHVYQPPPAPRHHNPNLSPALEAVMLRCLAKQPDARYPNARALVSALRAAVAGRAAPEPEQPPRRHGLKLILPNGREHPLHPGTWILGRSHDSDVLLEDAQVSRRHAELRVAENACVLIDLNSANGTYLNGQRLPPHTPTPLQPGAHIRLGGKAMVRVAAGPVSPAAQGGATVRYSQPATVRQDGGHPTTLPTARGQVQVQQRAGGQGRKMWMWLGGGVLVIVAFIFVMLLNGGGNGTASPTFTVSATKTPADQAKAQPTSPPDTVVVVVTATPKPGTTPVAEPATVVVVVTATPTRVPAASPTPKTPPSPTPASQNIIVYACGAVGDSDICLLDRDTNRARTIIRHSADDAEPDGAPLSNGAPFDNGALAFQSNREGSYDIFLADFDGNNVRNLTNSSGRDERMPDWSPDGRQLVYEVGDGLSNGELWVVDRDGSDAHRLLNRSISGRAPAWSPSQSDAIAFMRQGNDGYWRIVVLDLGSGVEVEFPHANEHCRFPAWSPDGRFLAYNTFVFGSRPQGQTYEIWRISADNVRIAPERLTYSGGNGRPTWSPDGARIAYNHGEYLYIMNADGSQVQKLTSTLNGWGPDWIW